MTHNSNEPRRAVVFLRARVVPHDERVAQAHLDAQRRHCQGVADELGFEIVREYAAIGGTHDGPVKETIRTMLDDLRTAPVDYVIVKSLDRLTRDMAEAARMQQAVSSARAKLVYHADETMNLIAELFASSIATLEQAMQQDLRIAGKSAV